MIPRIRKGNDFKHIWPITWNGQPEDFSDATDITLTAKVYGQVKALTEGVDYHIDGGTVMVDFTPAICDITGTYTVELNYIKPSAEFIDGDRRSAVDVQAFQIVNTSAEANVTEGVSQAPSEAMVPVLKYDDLTEAQKDELRGPGITSIEQTAASGSEKTYTITYGDSHTTTFTVNDGNDGHTPVISFVGTTIYVDGVAQVDLKGDKGADFTYEDFTQEQIDALKQPALQAASEADVAMSNLTAQVGSKLTEVDDRLNGITDMSPFSISSEEKVIGEYLLNGEKATIYEKTVELSALPTTANETKTYIISDQPLGYGLYFKVESFVASTGKGLSSQFFNSNYKITGYEINGDFNSVITIECVEAVSETVNGILHVRYCKFEGEVVELTLNLSSSDPIDVNGFTIPPLKYNKKFAIGMASDDSGADDWAKIFQYFNGGFINNYTESPRFWHNGMLTPTTGGWLSRALTYTDGCGVKRRFPVQVNAWYNLRTNYWFGPTKDIPAEELTRSASMFNFLYWQDIEQILEFDGTAAFHDVQDPAADDSEERTIQGIINGIKDAQDNYIYPRLGRRLLVMAEPNGDYTYTEATMLVPEIKAISRARDDYGWGAIDISEADISEKLKLFRYFHESWSLSDHQNYFLDNVISPSLTEGKRMYAEYGMHGFGADGNAPIFDSIDDINLVKLSNWLCDTYGEHGSDELWFCAQDELVCYLYTKAQTTIKAEQIGDKVNLKIFLPKIPDIYWNEISVLYNGGTLPVTGIDSPTNPTTLSHGNTPDGFMINLSTDKRLLNCAEKYTTIFENTFDNEDTGLVQYNLGNANYFIQRLNPALQAPFRNRVDALISEPVLSSISINNGDTTTQSQTVTISLNHSAGIPTHYKIGESSDLSLEEWTVIPSGDISFSLSAQFGVKTVYVQLMNAYGESDVVSDSIELVEADLALNSISINGGSLSTNNPSISVLFNLNGSATHYMISEDSAFAGAVWETMANPATFSLSTSSDGNKTVYAKLKNDNTGITSVVKSAVIELIDTVTVTLDSIQINEGAEFTGSDVVSILPSFSNDATHYRVGETSDLTSQTWILYTGGNISYTLTGGYGLRTVYLQLKNSESESSVKSDQIEYVQAVTLNSVSLAGGASDHEGTNVPVSITTSGGTPTHYRAGESSDLSAVAWVEYTGNFSYNFGSVGSKTLYVQVKNQISESSVASDSIMVSEAPLTLLVGYWGYEGKSNNQVVPVDVNGTIYNSFNPIAYSGYGTHNLYDNTGIETDLRVEMNSSYYQANEDHGFTGSNMEFTNSGNFDPTLSGDTGPHPDIVISQAKFPSAVVPPRLCLYLPAGQYKFRTIMSVSSAGALNETQRSNVFYRIYDMDYNVLAESSFPEGFTGLNNVDFNSEMVFTLTEGQNVYYTLIPHSSAGYRPAVNLIEITKLS